MNQIRNIAVSGVDTIEKYRRVCKLCGDKWIPPITLEERRELGRKILYDNKYENVFMNLWTEQNYSHCTLYTYEDFIAKYTKVTPEMRENTLKKQGLM